jgi:hypothetical protein
MMSGIQPAIGRANHARGGETMLGEVLGGGKPDRIDRILALTGRLREIREATDLIRYDNDLVTELPEVLRTLGDAREAVIAGLKTV